MKDHVNKILMRIMLVAGVAAGFCVPSFAQGTSTVSLALMPIQTAIVKGDVSKFRAMNWTKDTFQGGIRELKIDAKPTKDVTVSFDGSGTSADNDYAGHMLITKENVGYVKLNYDTFRKYYENGGGYYPFPTAGLNHQVLREDLFMDIGHFAMEVGKGTPEDSSFSLGYERGTKKGAKDSTTWGYVKDVAYNANTTIDRKKIAPVFIRKDETTDTVTAKEKMNIAGFTVKGEQQYVFFKAKSLRQEQIYSSTGAASETKISRQTEMPTTKEISAVFRGERWTLNDKNYISLGYRFGHVKNNMLYQARDYTSAGNFVPAGFLPGTTGTFRNGDAHSIEDAHTVTGMLMSNLTDTLTMISRVKGEMKRIYGSSDLYTLNVAEQGTRDQATINENKITNTAESISLRYAGLPKTSLYADMELSQERNWRSLDIPGTSVTVDPVFFETQNHVPEAKGTIGMRFTPISKVTLTTEVKHTEKNDKLSQVTGSEASYINRLDTVSDDLSARLSWKPFKWLENSFKIKQGMSVYRMHAYDFDTTKMPSTGRDFIYDVTLLPTDQLMLNFSYALQLSKTGGIGSQAATTPKPFTANVNTFSMSSSYAPTASFCFFNSASYSRAKNQVGFNTATPLSVNTFTAPIYATDAEWYTIDNGVKWSLKADLSVEPHYGWYAYRSFDGALTGNYNAHILWLDVTKKW